MTQKADPDDIIQWPCGTYCSRSELSQYGHKSDDYSVLYFDTCEWNEFMDKQDYEHR